MASALDLAGELRRLPKSELAERLSERQVSRPNAVKDAFDLADVLLDRPSVREVVTRLDRVALLVLRAAAHPTRAQELPATAHPAFTTAPPDVERALERLTRLFLVLDRDGVITTYEPVIEALDDDPALSLPALAETLPPVVLEAVDDVDRSAQDAASAERLFAVVVEVAEIVRAVSESPARQLARGGLALPETRRLAEAARIDVDDVAPLLDAARSAGLVDVGPDGWAPTSRADDWLLAEWADRWAALVAAWLGALPGEIRTVLDQRSSTSWGEPLRTFSTWYFPAGGAWVTERLEAFARSAALFGLTVDSRPTSAAVALLGDGLEAATDVVRALLPEPIENVYLQHDLTVVAPGPLAPALDARLRTIADVESAGLAATYRISEARIRQALTEGESADGVREFLRSLSSTGMPQPVDYLITETAQRHGRYRAHDLEPSELDEVARRIGAVSRLRSDDAALLDTVSVDQALHPLGLIRVDAHRMLCRFSAETVYWALSDERYPVLIEDAAGDPVRPPARRRGRRPASAPSPDPLDGLVERVTATATDDDTERAWIARQLDAAVKSRMTVVVSVAMPDGTTTDLQIEPTGVGGGRLRGRDRKSDIERTLPLSSIVGVATPDHD
ncbi:XPB/Ssl2-like helicase family protein [Frondihabitans sp. PhB188]|uniref:helicase-associated domain-containing protein n=1 Tax=Frondihabitans sp. PhB188 TaxID=2485200 RepID=UPI000F4631F0|nr:helicase-associated domain-containing protein [Frondihabitans sp. PhB188]ROQ38754.1 XPB/Ssl2-like helicase family protein [Frondihabitans sp. PhB188]